MVNIDCSTQLHRRISQVDIILIKASGKKVKVEIQNIKKLIIRMSKEAKERYLEKKCKDIEIHMRINSRNVAYK